ncbi:MAG: hypothetical protein EPO26_14615 [Chloroflexota bacterium]|nr:MAG: hypothetical protein EPO26_14615 [Chloroflexota bacterium]
MTRGRFWTALFAFVTLSFLALGARPTDSVDAASALAQIATTTPTYVWMIPNTPKNASTPVAACSGNPSANRDCLHVDPPSRKFIYYSANPLHTPVAAEARDMVVTSRRVSWRWFDPNRTAFVSGNVDRVRKTVRMTLLLREARGTRRLAFVRDGTPWTLPRATEPAIIIQDFRFVPRRRIIQAENQIQFQNSSTLRHSIVFSTSPGTEPTTGGAFSPIIGELNPGRLAQPFPLRPLNRPTPLPEAPAEKLWTPGTYIFYCAIHTFMTGVVVVPDS